MEKELNELTFSTNWNNKLDCMFFTTIRPRNDKKYIVGDRMRVTQEKVLCKEIEIIDIKHVDYNDLKDYTCYLDMGYNANETKSIIRTIYNKKENEKFEVSVILCKTLTA